MLRLASLRAPASPVAWWIEALPLLPLPGGPPGSSRRFSSSKTEGSSDAGPRPTPSTAPGATPAAPSAASSSTSSGTADTSSTPDAASKARTAADVVRSTLKRVNTHAKNANELLHALRSLEPLAPTMQEGAGRVAALHLQSLLQNYGRLLGLAAFSGATYSLWGALSQLSHLLGAPATPSTSYLALAGALASAASGVAYVRALYTLHPGAAYRAALLHLNTSPAVLEVMGAPLAGLGPRVAIVSSGGLAWGSGWPRPRAARVLLAFPLRGSECRGLALVEAKRLLGKVVVKALAVDVPGPGGAEERIYVVGGGPHPSRDVIFNEMRDPLIKVVALREEHAREDDMDASLARAAAEQARLAAQRQKAERKAAAEASAAAHREAAARAKAEAAADAASSSGAQAGGAAAGGEAAGSTSGSSGDTSSAGSKSATEAVDRVARESAASAAAAATQLEGSEPAAGGAAAAGQAEQGTVAKEGEQPQPTRWWQWSRPAAPPAQGPADTQQPGKP